MNPSPHSNGAPQRLPELDELQECDFELEAARFTYELTLRALGDDLDNPLKRADFEDARAELELTQANWKSARLALREREREFARLGATFQAEELAELRQSLEQAGFGGDDFDGS